MPKICNQCQSVIEEDGNFCSKCGSHDIREEVPAPAQGLGEPTVEVVGASNNGLMPVANSLAVGDVSNSDGSFADVPSFMMGDTPTLSNEIAIPKEMELPNEEATTPPTVPASTPLPNAQISQKRMAAKKKKKRIKILAIGIIVGSIVLLIAFFLFLYFYGKADSNQKPFSNEDPAGEVGSGGDYSNYFTAENSFRVGSEEFGFISIPKTWHKFQDQNGNNTLQYSDGTWIATLYALPTTSMRAADWANSNYNELSKRNVDSINTSTGTIASYKAYIVTTHFTQENKYFTLWFFESKSGKTHYLGLEGPSSTGDIYNVIYSFREDQ